MYYGPHIVAKKRTPWSELMNVKNNHDISLIVMGDFNEIKCLEERLGCLNATRNMGEFVKWINDMELIDMPLNGHMFTWRRGSPLVGWIGFLRVLYGCRNLVL